MTTLVYQGNSQFPTQSTYLKQIDINFDGIPAWIVSKGIVNFFDNVILSEYGKYTYQNWTIELKEFFESVPDFLRVKVLEKAIEYGSKVYQYHLEKECVSNEYCPLNESWERRLSIATNLLEEWDDAKSIKKINNTPKDTDSSVSKGFTTARQVLAMHYIFEFCQVRNIDHTVKAKFIQFLTGKQTNAKTIKDTDIYKKVRNPFQKDDVALNEDLKFIRTYFEDLGLFEISKAITNEISKRER